jgi:hypothetical protein
MASSDGCASVDFNGDVAGEAAPEETAPGAVAVYLYGLIDGAAAGIEPGLAPDLDIAGEAGPLSPPVLHRAGPIAALIGMVPLSEYSGPDSAQHLGDLAWLAPRTMQHAAVLRQAMLASPESPVYPAPFATLFASRDSLSAFMLAHADTLGEFVRSVAGWRSGS